MCTSARIAISATLCRSYIGSPRGRHCARRPGQRENVRRTLGVRPHAARVLGHAGRLSRELFQIPPQVRAKALHEHHRLCRGIARGRRVRGRTISVSLNRSAFRRVNARPAPRVHTRIIQSLGRPPADPSVRECTEKGVRHGDTSRPWRMLKSFPSTDGRPRAIMKHHERLTGTGRCPPPPVADVQPKTTFLGSTALGRAGAPIQRFLT